MAVQIYPMTFSDLNSVKALSDRVFGDNYYTIADLRKILEESTLSGQGFSWLAKRTDLNESTQSVVAARITLPPGEWHQSFRGPKPQSPWGLELSRSAYFKTVFVDPDHTGQGLGGLLSRHSLQQLRGVADAVICHSWKESPHSSSLRYLKKLGFQEVTEHPGFWSDLDYECVICKKPPCQCTAIEMHLNLKEKTI